MKYILTGILFYMLAQLTLAQENKIIDKAVLLNPHQHRNYTAELYFRRNSSEITHDGKQLLDSILNVILKDTTYLYHIEIFGYTDTSGSQQYNLNLSNNRAQAVNSYLKSKFKGDTIKKYFTQCSPPSPTINYLEKYTSSPSPPYRKKLANIPILHEGLSESTNYPDNTPDRNKNRRVNVYFTRDSRICEKVFYDCTIPTNDTIFTHESGVKIYISKGTIYNSSYCNSLCDDKFHVEVEETDICSLPPDSRVIEKKDRLIITDKMLTVKFTVSPSLLPCYQFRELYFPIAPNDSSMLLFKIIQNKDSIDIIKMPAIGNRDSSSKVFIGKQFKVGSINIKVKKGISEISMRYQNPLLLFPGNIINKKLYNIRTVPSLNSQEEIIVISQKKGKEHKVAIRTTDLRFKKKRYVIKRRELKKGTIVKELEACP